MVILFVADQGFSQLSPCFDSSLPIMVTSSVADRNPSWELPRFYPYSSRVHIVCCSTSQSLLQVQPIYYTFPNVFLDFVLGGAIADYCLIFSFPLSIIVLPLLLNCELPSTSYPGRPSAVDAFSSSSRAISMRCPIPSLIIGHAHFWRLEKAAKSRLAHTN